MNRLKVTLLCTLLLTISCERNRKDVLVREFESFIESVEYAHNRYDNAYWEYKDYRFEKLTSPGYITYFKQLDKDEQKIIVDLINQYKSIRKYDDSSFMKYDTLIILKDE